MKKEAIKIELENQGDAQLMRECLQMILEIMSQGGISAKDRAKIKQWLRTCQESL